MTFEVVSTVSWNVLGTFEDEDTAREAVQFSVVSGGADIRDLIVYGTHVDGDPAGEMSGVELANWAGIDLSVREASAGGAAAY